MKTYQIIDTQTGITVKILKHEGRAILEADELNERLYQASQSPSDNPIGFNAFEERYRVHRHGENNRRETGYCRYCDTEVQIVDMHIHGYCLECMPFPELHKAITSQ